MGSPTAGARAAAAHRPACEMRVSSVGIAEGTLVDEAARAAGPSSAAQASPGADTRELARRVQAGDVQAFAELYDRFAARVMGLALRIVRSRADAEDVVQEVFVQAWRQMARFDDTRGALGAWLFTITRTRALDRLRRRAVRRETEAPPPEQAAFPAAAPQPEHALAVRQALAGLAPGSRAMLELAYYEGLSHSEIATRLRQPLGTVKTRIRAAMLQLRAALHVDPHSGP